MTNDPDEGAMPRRRFLHLAAGAAALPVVSRIVRAQTYPSHETEKWAKVVKFSGARPD